MHIDSSEHRLAQLGYRQDLQRALSHFGNFAVSFSLQSILAGITTSFGIGYNHGGPVTVVWTWIAHFLLSQSIVFSMAELCSSMPTAGGLFSWSYQLGGRLQRFWSWVTGWFILMAWIAGTTSAAFGFTYVASTMVVLSNGGIYNGGHLFTNAQFLGVIAAVLVAQGSLCLLPVRILGMVNKISVFWNALGAVTLMILLPSVAPSHQSAKFVFTEFDEKAYGHYKSNGYSFLLGYTFAVYCQSGLDTSVHMSEETKTADRGAAKNLIISFWANSTYGFAFLLAILFSMQETSSLQLLSGQAGGFTIAQIFVDIFEARFQSRTGATVALGIPLIAIFLGGSSSMLVSTRILWAFARDGALPFSSTLQRVTKRMRVPVYAAIFTTLCCIILSLPILGSEVAFTACISMALVSGCTAYTIPIALKALTSGSDFVKGPINMGSASRPVNVLAVTYLLFICGLAVMPNVFPITSATLNYAPVAWGVIAIFALTLWFLPFRLGARQWYAGMRTNLDNFAYNYGLPEENGHWDMKSRTHAAVL